MSKGHDVPLAAFVLHTDVETGLISDGNAHRSQEPRGGKQSTETCGATFLSTDSAWDRARNCVSVNADDNDDGDGEEENDDDNDYNDDESNSARVENALYVLVRYPPLGRLPTTLLGLIAFGGRA
jgi:hypothetical protein